ncbi:MAG TPA: phospho-N-acetylmuramoyl-pentapeptide-transferase [Pseudogracilibacillus sp.]|nr:phospho-N-acetylmuramoyl-pentapeptide-transferase [Pseudogracilibacillus sp.]
MNILYAVSALVISFLLTVLIGPFVIPYLRKLKFGQSIREDGPQSHLQKTGTPTMGGVMIIISIIITYIFSSVLLFNFSITYEFWLLLFVLIGYGLIGFLDDFIIVAMKRNLGLTSKQKLIGQLVIAVVFFITLKIHDFPTDISIPGLGVSWDLGWGYGLLIIFMLVGASNAVNLTDGLDGLLAGTASAAFGAFAFLAFYIQSEVDIITMFALTVVGALLGFLVFNAHPAKVFMGDTGSLALGAAIAAIAILTKTEIILIVIGGVFVIETISVILQVISFKTTGKRLFKMSPIHHHFELIGWSEWRVVVTFWFVGVVVGLIGIFIEVGLS